jgi:hypothetical protein
VQKEGAFEGGSEMDVSRIRLHYGGRHVDGFLLKEPTAGDAEWKKAFVNDIFCKWKQLREINIRRRREGKTIFTLPRTVRILENEEYCGILVTDLSEGGVRKVLDLKEFLHGRHVSPEAWTEIQKQIERDIEIAYEEGICLDNGPEFVDPWLVVQYHDGYKAILSDVGGYTSFYNVRTPNEAIRRRMAASKSNLLGALQKINDTLSEGREL